MQIPDIRNKLLFLVTVMHILVCSLCITVDDRVSVTATSIPMHLEEMMKILEQEDQENTGGATVSCMPCFSLLVLFSYHEHFLSPLEG